MNEFERFKKELKTNFSKGMKYSFQSIESVLNPDSEKYDDFLLQKSRFNDCMTIVQLNTQPHATVKVELEQLRMNLLTLIKSLEPNDITKFSTSFNDTSPANRKSNFFELLKIYQTCLEDIKLHGLRRQGSEQQTTETTGKSAVNMIFYGLNSQISKCENKEAFENELDKYFYNRDNGVLEVYFASIKNILTYIEQGTVDNDFYNTTFTSLLSRYEKGLCIYYCHWAKDTAFKELLTQSKFMEDTRVKNIMMDSKFIG